MQVDALRPDTRELFRAIDQLPEIREFTLIGGTALALHHAHRESEDLDFVYTPASDGVDTANLPLRLTAQLIERLRSQGRNVISILDQGALELAENEGAYLPSAHQDWAVDGVKLTLFAGDTADRVKKFRMLPIVQSENIKLLTSEAIFETKSRLIVTRNTTRDLFDLWYFLTHQGKTVAEIIEFAKLERPYYDEELIKRRLLPTKPSVADPGFKPIIEDAPADFSALISALTVKVNEYEQVVAAEVLDEESIHPAPPFR